MPRQLWRGNNGLGGIDTTKSSHLYAHARFVDQAPDDEAWRLLHHIADAASPHIFTDVVAILGSIGLSLNREDLARWIATDNRMAAIDALSNAWEQLGDFGLRERLIPQMRDMALAAAEATPLVGIDIAFNVRDPEAIAAIEQYAGQQITAISETTREAIRGIVTRTFETGTPLTQQISEIETLVGLTPRQAERLARFRQGLLDEGTKPTDVQQAVERLARKMRRDRAEAIARTESINAVSQGQHLRWEQAARDSLLDIDHFRRFWVVTPDDRLCTQICALIPAMNTEGRRLDEPFATPIGPILHPTAHPQCRCALDGHVVPA